MWGVSSAGVVAVLVGWLLLGTDNTSDRAIGDLTILVLSIAATICTFRAARVTCGRIRLAWTWQCIGVAALAINDVLEFSQTALGGLDRTPVPSVADLVYLVYPLATCLALVRFPPNNIRFRTRVVLDGVIVSVALFEVIWQLVLKDVYHAGASNPVRFAVIVAYPLSDVLIVAVALMVLPRVCGTARLIVGLLAVGAVFNAYSDGANVYTAAFHTDAVVTASMFIGWGAASLCLIGAALLARGMPETQDDADDRPSVVPTRMDVWLPYIAVALAIVVAAPQVIPPLSRGPLLVTSGVLMCAMAVRHAIVVFDNRRLHSVVSDQALRDPLTGLANRVLFRDRVVHAVHLRQRDNRAVAVVLLNLDEFRRINSDYGQVVGDDLLVFVANRLMNAVRAGDTVARIGADEFAIVMEGAADQARLIAHRVVRAFDEPFAVDGRSIGVRPSVGFAIAADSADVDASGLLDQVELAMQAAKRAADHGLHTFSEDMRSTTDIVPRRGSTREAVMLKELRDAIDDDELSVVYQPKIDVRTGLPVGVEALVRWPHRELGLLAPDSFLPLVRQHGLMSGVTERVLCRALDDVVRWKAAGVLVPVAVNLSAPSASDAQLPAYIATQLAARGLTPTILTVEITEDLLLENTQRASSVLDRLRASGIRIALDDFGSGYSALWYLRDLSFDEVKLDRQFITPLLSDRRAAVIVRAVIDLAHDLGGTVVAEGVENAETVATLRDYGCEIAQGFHFSAPLPAEDTLTYFKKAALRAPAAARPN